jgi:hypothetical protein
MEDLLHESNRNKSAALQTLLFWLHSLHLHVEGAPAPGTVGNGSGHMWCLCHSIMYVSAAVTIAATMASFTTCHPAGLPAPCQTRSGFGSL